ncbi:uncharacterized protein LOC142233326 [Haematobia irritans]|uniref:uncharacterized protein LOC142233326 n=1 Tax=Haematobia irritans TaxID=7368 RepID=UPI003F4F63C3
MAVFEQHNHVNIWWFPKNFCQSTFGEYRRSGTNSCTVISLILANKISKELVFAEGLPTHTLPPNRAVEIFANAMNEGNRIYGSLFDRTDISPDGSEKRRAPNLNIPEAITALAGQINSEFQLQEWFYTHLMANPTKESYMRTVSTRIADVIKLAIRLFNRSFTNEGGNNLFIALIADNRTTVFVIEFPSNKIAFFDSHHHGRRGGSVIALCPIEYLEEIVNWFVHMAADIYHSRPTVYEISFLTTTIDAINLISPLLADN